MAGSAALLLGALVAWASAAQGADAEPWRVLTDHNCDGHDEEWGACTGMDPCETCIPVDCVLGEWSGYSGDPQCTGLRGRHRSIKLANNECGAPCTGSLTETEKYTSEHCTGAAQDCAFSAWSSWTDCASSVDQAMRWRTIEAPPENGGATCTGGLNETKACGHFPQPHPCQFDTWQEWTECSVSCGTGRYTRMRVVKHEAENGGTPCSDAVLETRSCEAAACPAQDCEVSSWTSWSSCGANVQRYRSRKVTTPPQGGGKRCPAAMMETMGCLQPEAADLEVSEWSEWSECDRTCEGGQTFRSRSVALPALSGGHIRGHALKQAAACNTGPCWTEEPDDCQLGHWSEWSGCSSQCGLGSKVRHRKIAQEAAEQGKGCEGALREVVPCVSQDCAVVDCKWSGWDSWSACSTSCGGGGKKRNRAIAMVPENGGKACPPQETEEIAPCNTQSCDEGCIDGQYGDWQEWTACSATCSSGFRTRRRDVQVEPNRCGQPASGLKEEFQVCSELEPCVEKQDCEMAHWGEWSQCSDACFGVRERNRFIATFAKGGGQPCTDAIQRVEPCNPGVDTPVSIECGNIPKLNCVMSRWKPWTECTRSCGGGQQTRSRHIAEPASGGGLPCEDTLSEVAPCNTQPCDVVECADCLWGQWSAWSGCSHCGGQRFRSRSIERPANECGKPCEAHSAREATNCTSTCGKDYFCAWSQWSSPSQCFGCGSATTMRDRSLTLIQEKPAEGFLYIAAKDASCSGSQLNVTACPLSESCAPQCVPRDCAFAVWSDWGPASSRAVGLCERQRVVSRSNNECGKPCDGLLAETKRCLVDEAGGDEPLDCVWSEWKEHNTCDSNGMGGQRYRTREIVKPAALGGKPCDGVLQEVLGCRVQKMEPCHFDAWGAWGACSASCGHGLQKRVRKIVALASGGGEQCAGSLEEAQECTGTGDDCSEPVKQDCQVGGWQEWEDCDRDGQKYRERKISQPALAGGKPCEESLQETEACKPEKVDCVFSKWTSWDSCDRRCGGGQTRRQREIHVFPEHGGKLCPADLIQTQGCNTMSCTPHNCQVSEWSNWTACSATCGASFQQRVRDVLSLRSLAGQGCDTSLGETRQCEDVKPCDVSDCEWGNWKEWGDCSKHCGGGNKVRVRDVPKAPVGGGNTCPAEDMEEIKPCNTQSCDSKLCKDGAWANWTAWAPCSASCGGGQTFRTREVKEMASECGKPAEGMDREVAFCNTQSCSKSIDCELSEWGHWGDCSGTCSGVKRRSRQVKRFGSGEGAWCKGALKETAPCNPGEGEDYPESCQKPEEPVDCELDSWGLWSDCSVTCGGGGSQNRSRGFVREAQHGGKGCSGDIDQVQECGREACAGPDPIDCEYGDWAKWGACSKCSGERKRLRKITQYAQHGGRNCESHYSEEVEGCPRECDEQTFCTWQSWNAWSECSATCGTGGKRHRRRYLEISNEKPKAGVPVSVKGAMSKYEAAYRRTQDLEKLHIQQLFLAFVVGCVTLVVGFAAARLGRSRLRRGGPRGVLEGHRAGTSGEEAMGADASSVYQRLHAPNEQEHASVDSVLTSFVE